MGLGKAGVKEDSMRQGEEWQCTGFARFSEHPSTMLCISTMLCALVVPVVDQSNNDKEAAEELIGNS
jgi:hypothetical protein